MSDEPAENDPAWAEACRREETIGDLLRRFPRRMTKRAVEDAAWELVPRHSEFDRLRMTRLQLG